MSNQTLLTPNDVRVFSPIRKINFAPCDFDQIYQEELALARNCFGLDLWTAMIAAKVDYSAAVEYVPGSTYNLGDVVIYNGVLRSAKAMTTKDPSFSSDWENAPRFEGSCAANYDDLFCNHLGPFIANTILANRMPFIRAQITQSGVINPTGNGQQKATDAEFKQLVGAVQTAANQAWSNTEWYMDQDAQKALKETCFAGWPPYQEDLSCEGNSKGLLKRTGWYDFG